MNAHQRRVASRKTKRISGFVVTKQSATIEGSARILKRSDGSIFGSYVVLDGLPSDHYPGLKMERLQAFEDEALKYLRPEDGARVRITIEIVQSH